MAKKTKADPVRSAREALRAAVDECCVARGEAQWVNGYRTGRANCGAESEAEDKRLFDKEMRRFEWCAVVEQRMERKIAALIRQARMAGRCG